MFRPLTPLSLQALNPRSLATAMLLPLLLGFLLGAAALLFAEAALLLLLLDRLRRPKNKAGKPPPEPRHLDAGSSLAVPSNKKGTVWVLEPEKVPKVSTNESPPKLPREQKNKDIVEVPEVSTNESLPKLPREQKNKDIVEVFPVKKYASIKGHSLILSDLDGSQATIELQNCTIVAVSATNLSSRKWAKRYPIKLESKTSVVYNGSKTCYLYLDTSWEKESWCKELRLASCLDKEKLIWYAQLREEFHNYLASLNSEYPSFLKPSTLFGEVTDRSNRTDGSSSRVRLFLKKLAKKSSKPESKQNSVSSSIHVERKVSEKLHAPQDAPRTNGLVKSASDNRSSSGSLKDLVQPSSPTPNYLGNNVQHPIFPDTVCNENFVNDEGTLCWNLLLSRLFFDAKRNVEMNNAIKARIQKTLSNMRTPSYINGVICTGLDLGNLPPYIHKMRALPMDLNEVWVVEVDIEYAGGIILDFETRIGVCEPELQEDILKTSIEPSSAGELTSDLLEGIEHYGNQLKSSSNPAIRSENRDEGDRIGVLKQTKSASWTSTYVSRWKAIKQSFANQVSQVPLSLAVRVASLRGTLRLHIKPPPSDQLWCGFTSMPEIEWNLESSIGDRKITNAHIALLIGNRFKVAIRETLVLPNCESIYIPFMLAEKDDWVPRAVAPFMKVNQESMDMTEHDSSNAHNAETKLNNVSKAGLTTTTTTLDEKEERVKNIMHVVQEQPREPLPEVPAFQGSLSVSSGQSSRSSSASEELRVPLLSVCETQESCNDARAESSRSSTSRSLVVPSEERSAVLSEEDLKQKKIGRRARMLELGKKMGEKFEEKKRHVEEKGRFIVDKMRENSRN